MILILAGLLAISIVTLLMLWTLRHAAVGYEDGAGFHYGKHLPLKPAKNLRSKPRRRPRSK